MAETTDREALEEEIHEALLAESMIETRYPEDDDPVEIVVESYVADVLPGLATWLAARKAEWQAEAIAEAVKVLKRRRVPFFHVEAVRALSPVNTDTEKIDGAGLCQTCHPLLNLPATYTIEGWNALQEHFAAVHPDATDTEKEGDRG